MGTWLGHWPGLGRAAQSQAARRAGEELETQRSQRGPVPGDTERPSVGPPRAAGTEELFPLPFLPQDLAWMITFYVRISLSYVPLLGLKGFLGLFFIVR